jgi:hypothetical protein
MAGIPGLDVTELMPETIHVGPNGGAIPNLGNPGNPVVGANGSPQAQAFRGLRTPPAPSSVPGAAQATRAFRAGRALAGGLRGAAPLAVGAAVAGHLGDYKINDPDVDSSAGGTLRALGRGDLGGVGRSLSKGMLETGMDLGSAVANGLDYVVPGKAPVSSRYNQFLRDQFGDQLQDSSGPAPAAPAAAPTTLAAEGPGTGDFARADRATEPTPGAGNVTRDGNSYSGQNIREGFSINGRSVAPSVVPGSGQSATPAEVAAAARAADAFGPGAHNPDGTGGYATMGAGPLVVARNQAQYDKDRVQYLAEQGLKSTDRAVRAAAMESLGRNGGNDSAERVATLREQGETVRANAANRTQMAIHQANNSVSLRGQDVTARGQDISARTAATQARIEQMNKDRQFGLDVQKFGEEQAKRNFDQRQASVKDTHDFIKTVIPPGADGKPDDATAARYTTALNAMVDQRKQALQDHLAQNPGDAQAKAELAHITDKGLGALDETAKRKFLVGLRAADVATQNHSVFNPFGGTAVDSQAPITSLKRRPGLISDDYVSNRGDVIPARALDKTGSTLGIGGLRNPDYDILKR